MTTIDRIVYVFSSHEDLDSAWINGTAHLSDGSAVCAGGGWVDGRGHVTPYEDTEAGDVDDLAAVLGTSAEEALRLLHEGCPRQWSYVDAACHVCGDGLALSGPTAETVWTVCQSCQREGYTADPGEDVRRAIEPREESRQYIIDDPFAGDLPPIEADSPEEAVDLAYEDVPPEERPVYVRIGGVRYDVPGGTCAPTQ